MWWWFLPLASATLIDFSVTTGGVTSNVAPGENVALAPEPFVLHANNECAPGTNESLVNITGLDPETYPCGPIAVSFPAPQENTFQIRIDDVVLTFTSLQQRPIQSNFLKLILFQPLIIHPVMNGGVGVTVRVDTAYYVDSKTLTVINIGQCSDPLVHDPPTCGNLPLDWLGDPWIQDEPTSYNTSHLVDPQWRRYPAIENTWVSSVTPIGPWRMGFKHDRDLNVPGIQYNLTTTLHDMVQHCEVDVDELDNTIDHAFNVSLLLMTEDGVHDCNSNPYLIRLNREVHAVIAHDVSNGIGVQIVSASYESCDCDVSFAQRLSNLYPCSESAYRLVVVLLLDVPQKHGYVEGIRMHQDVVSTGPSEQCFGFPRDMSWSAAEEAEYIRTTLTMKSACMSLGVDSPDCNRFNRCHKTNTPVSDYSLLLNLQQCPELSCLQPESDCTCSDNPPDELPIQLNLHLFECPQEVLTETMSFTPIVHAFAGTNHPTGKFQPLTTASYHFHDHAVIGLETHGMGVRIRDLYICHVNNVTWVDCVTKGVGCPMGIEAGCNLEDWVVYCVEHGCEVPIDHRYVIWEQYESYNDVYFESYVCKTKACDTCVWDIQGETDTMDAVTFKCEYLVLEKDKQTNWVLDITGILLACHGMGTRDVQHPRVVQTLNIGPTTNELPTNELPPLYREPTNLLTPWYGIVDALVFLLIFVIAIACFK